MTSTVTPAMLQSMAMFLMRRTQAPTLTSLLAWTLF